MQNIQYKETGNKIPIKMDELMNFIYDKLDQYDRLTKAVGAKPDYNPYVHPILYTNQEGRTVEIPDEVHKLAVENWKSRPKSEERVVELPGFSKETGAAPILADREVPSRQPEVETVQYEQPVRSVKEDIEEEGNMKLYICGSVVLAGLLVFCLHKQGKIRFNF